jgi:hypothetical protein
MRPGQILLHPPLDGRSTYRFTCPACLEPVEKPADRKAAALLLAAGVDLATEDPLLGDRHTDGVVTHQMGYSSGPALTSDDLLTFHFLLMDDAYIEEFLEGRSW